MLEIPVPLLPITDARQRIHDAVRPLPAEVTALDRAGGRVLAEDVRATGDVPPFPCSAMDGYAIHAGPADRRLRLSGESRAGAPSDDPVGPGDAVRVSTGAAIPVGADAVIAQEDTERDGATVLVRTPSSVGDHVRGAGEDMREGTIVLDAGTRLGPIELGAAVAAGRAELTTARAPRVAVLSTGDELRAPGEPLGPGEIHNSNAPMLIGLAERCGAVALPSRRLPDDRPSTIDGIRGALADADEMSARPNL